MLIVTHNHIFHADEVFAIATLSVFNNIPVSDMEIIRTRDEKVIAEAQADPDVWVLDVGLLDQPHLSNCDHHQDLELPASNVLVITELMQRGIVSSELQQELLPFYNGISMYDTNKQNLIQEFSNFAALKSKGLQLTTHIISGFNRSPMSEEQDAQFLKAVEFATSILENEIHSANERIKAKQKKLLLK